MNPTTPTPTDPIPEGHSTTPEGLEQAYTAKVAAAMADKKDKGELDGADPQKVLMVQAEVGRSIVKGWLQARRAANKGATFAADYDPAQAARAEAQIAALLNPAKPKG